jgi:hypothetical protein
MTTRATGEALLVLTFLAAASGCTPSSVIGPLQREQEERDKILARGRTSGVSEQVLNVIDPPLTPDEERKMFEQDRSCRKSYMWKNGLTWTGSILVAVAAGVTLGGAADSSVSDTSSKVLLGVSAGSLAALGSGLVAIGGILQNGFTDRGCWVR